MSKPFFITCAIPYVNAQIHIGNSLEYVLADVIARAARAKGREVKFLVGTDEHGQKIAEAAAAAQLTPQAFADQNVAYFQQALQDLNISNDDFIRTTDQKRHWPVVSALWRRLAAAGDLYKKEYEGLYCVGCESFKTKSDLDEDGNCPLHRKKPEVVLEENWFFRLSKYQAEVGDFIKSAVVPQWRQQELLNFVAQGLTDISFSRPKSKLTWGIPVPDDPEQVIYVWCDALTNYLSAAAQVSESGQIELLKWPADVHVIGKDIVKFHAVYWPAMLLSAGLPLPHQVLVHGFLTIDHQKISKSLGNVVLPHEVVAKYGTDALRYFYLHEVPTTDDGDFSYDKLGEVYTAELANTIGNLFQRVLVMATKYEVKWEWADQPADQAVVDQILSYDLQAATEAVASRAGELNKRIQEFQPWEKIKEDAPAVRQFLAQLLDELAVLAATLEPFVPQTADRMRQQLQSRQPEPLFPPVS